MSNGDVDYMMDLDGKRGPPPLIPLIFFLIVLAVVFW